MSILWIVMAVAVAFGIAGLYFCNSGGSCTCNHISDKPGKCHCGMELHTAST
jgi:hypothetical protein